MLSKVACDVLWTEQVVILDRTFAQHLAFSAHQRHVHSVFLVEASAKKLGTDVNVCELCFCQSTLLTVKCLLEPVAKLPRNWLHSLAISWLP